MSSELQNKVPWHRDPQIRGIAFQVAAAVFLVWMVISVAHNTAINMESRGIIIGLDFMTQISTFNVGFTPFWDFKLGKSEYYEVFIIAVQNTIFVSACGIVGATLLGFLVGVMRLSPNWLVAKIAAFYVEFFRNIPLLLWFFFWYVAVFLPLLPGLQDSINLGNFLYINNEGLYLPKPLSENAFGTSIFIGTIIAAFVGIFYLARWAKQRQIKTGEQFPLIWGALAILIVVPFIGYFIAGQPLYLQYPTLGTFQLKGGLKMGSSFFVCWFALTTYTAAFIAENVRGGILAVSHGQTEASRAIGLSHKQTLNLVVIPQAMRVIIPPTISQFLNLTKNSTLAVAIAYEEIASLWMGIALNTTGQALIIIAMSIGVFWVLSFMTSAILNWYNKKVQLTER